MMDNESKDESADDARDEEVDGVEDNDGAADEETSLDALTAAYAGLVGAGEAAPSDEPVEDTSEDTSETQAQAANDESDESDHASPLGILEAVLFVGNAENTPLTAKRIAALMRGVSPREIDELVIELNDKYHELECPYQVISQEIRRASCRERV